MKHTDFKKMTIKKATEVPERSGTYEIMAGFWWSISEDNCLLFYRGQHKQCNKDKHLVGRITDKSEHPGVRVEYIPVVYLPITIPGQDWDYEIK